MRIICPHDSSHNTFDATRRIYEYIVVAADGTTLKVEDTEDIGLYEDPKYTCHTCWSTAEVIGDETEVS